MSGNQFKGLFIKNIQLIKRQKGSLICQIITPLFCLGFIALIKLIVETQIKTTGYGIKLSLPILFNIPIYSKFQYSNDIIHTTTCEEWYMFGFGPNANTSQARDFFGKNTGLRNETSYGMLSSQKGIVQQNCPQVERMSPYFKESDDINGDLFDQLELLNNFDFNKLVSDETTISGVPDGAILINSLNSTEFSYRLQVNDNRLPPYHRGNGITKIQLFNNNTQNFSNVVNVVNGMLWATDLFNKAYFNHFFNDVVIVSGVQIMPIQQDDSSENIQRIINLAGSTFYPMAISLLMPLFMYTIVLEKESKLVEIMKINGMKMRYYWLSNFSFNYSLYFITMLVFNLVGAFAFNLSLFTHTDPYLLVIIYVGWGLCQVGMAFFFQAFLSNARSATIIGYIISLWTTLMAVSLNLTIFDLPNEVPTWLLFYPTVTICRIFYYLTMKCGYSSCIASLSDIDPELKLCIVLLYVTPWIYMFLGMYFYEVLPQQFGVRKHPLFCIRDLWHKSNKSRKIRSRSEEDLSRSIEVKVSEDDEINEEMRKVQSIEKEERIKFPLICDRLTKIYAATSRKEKEKKALNGLNLCLNNNEIFGLLGPNGAGKTTFFSLLTGIYEPTAGDAWVGGNSIKRHINKVQEMIGYCPQFDLLWNDLSVEEHLFFYSRLKNVQVDLAQKIVEQTLRDIKLERFRHFLVSELSGGMKRRLSLGISLVGNPSIVFLDEPTTGLDPENKRQIWEILANCKENKCMILTTHLMEEAEVLSDRIGIIVNGGLKCLGTQYKLKKQYGKGFKLVLNMTSLDSLSIPNHIQEDEFIEERKQKLTGFIRSMFPRANLYEEYKNTLIFEISNEEFDAEVLFNQVEAHKDEMQINNWAISQVTLEDIFIRLTEHDL